MLESIFKSEKGKIEAKCFLACSPDTDKEIFHVSLLKTVLPFLTNKAVQFCSRGIADFIFSYEFHVAIPLMDHQRFLIKP